MTTSSDTEDGLLDFPTLVSVVIPTRNVATLLSNQLEALARQTYGGPWEVVIADNGSTDGTLELALSWAGKLPGRRVVRARHRRGVNHARNIGAAAARGDLLIFCDADDIATRGWLQAMAEVARTADIVGGYLDQEALNDPRIRSWRPMPQSRDCLPIRLEFLPYAAGASLGVRTAIFRALGGFNEDYASGGDEVEFCWRAQLASHVIAFAPEAVMLYRFRSELWPHVRQAYGYGRAEAQLYRDFKDRGVPAINASMAARGWVRLLRRLPELTSPEQAGRWLFSAAWRIGRLTGSLRYHVICL